MAQTVSGRNWTLTVNQEWIDVTSERESPDERWTFTDSQGHDHRYERGYPTLDLVVDESHWCDGREGIYNHDPHEQIDRSHYECEVCREVIEPAMHPPYHPNQIPGMRSATLTGYRSDGAQVEVWLQDDELDRVGRADSDSDITALIDSLPEERIYSVTFASR
jgi:hypothetical protein